MNTPAAASSSTPSNSPSPPELPGHPLLGSVPDIKSGLLPFYLRVRRTHGDFLRIRFTRFFSWYMVAHPDNVERVLNGSYQSFPKGLMWKQLRAVLGDGLLTSDGDTWRDHRRALQPHFHRRYYGRYTKAMEPSIARLLSRWQVRARSSQAFDITGEMMNLTLCNASLALFGMDLDDQADKIGRDLAYVLDYVHAGPKHAASPLNRSRFRQAMRGLNLQIKRIAEKRRARWQEGEEPHDLLHALLTLQSGDGKTLTAQQFHDEMMTFIFTGHETTAIALAWMWYLLSLHPECEAKLHAEVDSVLNGRAPTNDDYNHLPYTRMVFQEAMRLYPPVWGVARQTVQDEEIGGYLIPAKSVVSVLPYLTHRHPEFWPNPEAFDPERFTPEVSKDRPRYAYFPFGGGARQCIGNQFAMHEAVLVTASIAQRYKLRFVSGHPIDPMPSTTLRPRHGILMTLHER